MLSNLKRRKPHATPEYEKARTLQEQYAALCALHVPDSKREPHYRWALGQFSILCALEGVKMIGIDPKGGTTLFVGTCPISIWDDSGTERDIGEFIISIDVKEKKYLCKNVTRQIGGQFGEASGYHHPHIGSSGALCITEGEQELQNNIVEGDLVHAVGMLLLFLHTANDAAYHGASLPEWPVKIRGEEILT